MLAEDAVKRMYPLAVSSAGSDSQIATATVHSAGIPDYFVTDDGHFAGKLFHVRAILF